MNTVIFNPPWTCLGFLQPLTKPEPSRFSCSLVIYFSTTTARSSTFIRHSTLYISQTFDSRYKLTGVLSLCLFMSVAKFTRIEIYIYRNKSLSNAAQIYDVTYIQRQAVGWVGYTVNTTQGGRRGRAL